MRIVCGGPSQLVCACAQAWSQLGNMSGVEAMRLYVRTLDEEQVGTQGSGLAAPASPPMCCPTCAPPPAFSAPACGTQAAPAHVLHTRASRAAAPDARCPRPMPRLAA